jgi:hypothetical protein
MSKILNIYNEDGSLYWKAHFNNEEDLARWLEEEKTRPYWNKNFKIDIEEIKLLSKEEIEKHVVSNEDKIFSAKQKLLALGLDEKEILALLGI